MSTATLTINIVADIDACMIDPRYMTWRAMTIMTKIDGT